MSEETKTEVGPVELPGLFVFKEGMTQIVDDKGELVTCSVLRYEPTIISQIKLKTKDGYDAVQLAFGVKKIKNSTKARRGHLKASGKEAPARWVRELRVKLPAGATVGSPLAISSLKKGDWVKVTAHSKGKGFAGVVKRWNAGGGPGAHGSTFHRQPGSVGNRTWPGRIMKGKHFPGHLGDEKTTVKGLRVLDVVPEDNLVLLSGPVPGGRNTLVKILKEM